MKPNPPIHRVDAKLLLYILLTHVLLTDTHTFNTVDTYSSSNNLQDNIRTRPKPRDQGFKSRGRTNVYCWRVWL